MSRALLRRCHLYAHRLISPPPLHKPNLPIIITPSLHQNLRSFSSSDSTVLTPPPPPPEASPPPDTPTPPSSVSEITSLADFQKSDPPLVEDVSNAELEKVIKEYDEGDDDVLPSLADAIFRRQLAGKHKAIDDKLIDELRIKPLTDVKDREFDSDLDEALDTDEDIGNLYNARDYVQKKLTEDEFFNMDDHKWDEMVKEGVEKGFIRDTKECEDILEDMLCWDKLLPDEIKKKVEARFNELGDMCERGEMEPKQAYELFKEFEDKMVLECAETMEAEQPPEENEIKEGVKTKKVHLDDPPGEGPILRWESRIVFAPGGDAWHPKNRKVKLAVTVKELELSKHAFRRLRELVGKRYHPGRDELTITSERFEHREENRKDCLRTLYSLIAESMKANKLVEEARNAHTKEKLRANPKFMERLRAKAEKMRESEPVPL